MKKEEFKELLEKLKNREYEDSKLEIYIDYYHHEAFEDRIGNEGAVLLAEALKKNPHIAEVRLFNQNIKDEGAIALSKVDSLNDLDLGKNSITARGLKALARSNLKALCVSGNGFFLNSKYEEELLPAFEALIKNKTIERLELVEYPYIPDKLAAELIRRNTTVQHLNLTDNNLTDEALKYIENNKTIEYLNVWNNKITDIGAGYIARNNSIKILIINKNWLTEAGAKLLSTHPTLEKLRINDKRYYKL